MYVSYHKVEYSGVLIHNFQFTQGILKNPIIPIYQVDILTNFFLCIIAAEGGLQLGITTWYMGESNYRDMIEGKTVQVFLPLPREDTGNYYIPVFGFAYYKGNGECFFRREGSDSNVEIEREDKLAGGDLHVLRYDIHGMPSSSGIYVFNCAASGNTTKQIKIHLVMVQGNIYCMILCKYNFKLFLQTKVLYFLMI